MSGGIGSSLSGGNFWDGVVIGGIVAGLNHELHKPKSTSTFKVVDSNGDYVGKIKVETYDLYTAPPLPHDCIVWHIKINPHKL